MMKHRFNNLKIGVLCIMSFLVLFSSQLIGDDNAAWLKYEKAAVLFKQKAHASEILDLLKEVQSATEDSILIGRAAFLLSAAYERDNQPEKAILELQKLDEPGSGLPETILAESWLRIGLLHLKQDKIKLAKAYFAKAAEGEANQFMHREALLGLAWIAAEQNEWATCDSLVAGFTSDGYSEITDERITILKARQAIASDKADDAIEMLSNSQSQAGLYYLAKAYEKAEKRIMAVSVYKKLQDVYYDSPIARHALFQAAEVFMRAGDWLAARSELRRLLNSGLGNTDAIHYRLGWVNVNLNHLDQALEEFQTSYAPENASYFKYMQAECLRRQGATDSLKLDKSILMFHNIASVELKSPLAPLAKLKAALTEMEKGDSSGALVSLRQFSSLYPKDELMPAVYFLLGANETPAAGQRYFDKIIQQNQDSKFFDVSYFALQNHDFNGGDYQKVITRNASMPQESGSAELSYWQRANHLLMGESAYFLKHPNQALTEYQLAKVDKKDDLTEKAMIGEAWCKLQLEGADQALTAFEELRDVVNGSNKILVKYGYATVHFLSQNYMEALKSYPVATQIRDFPELTPLVVNSLFRRGQCFYRLESYMQAIEAWDELASSYPHSKRAVESLFSIADVYFRANHFAEADSMYQIIINTYPDDPLAAEGALKLASSAYNASNYEEAVTRYQSFIENYPEHEKNKEALEGIQLSYYQLGQVSQASEVLQKVVEQTSNADLAIDARYRIAANYYQEENYPVAIEAFKEILTLYPNSTYAVDAQFALSKCYLALEDYQSALDEFLRFVQYFPESAQIAEAYFFIGVGYYQMESYLSAIDYFDQVIQDYANSEYHGPALKNSAWCYDHLQEKQKAIQLFSNYLAEYPSAEDAQTIQLQVGRLLLETGNIQDAITKLETLQRANDLAVSLEASYRLGMHYLSNDKVTKAEQSFKTATNPDGGDNYYRLSSLAQLAALYENQNEQNKAISTYELLANSTDEERWTVAAKERIDLLRFQAQNTQ